MKIKRIIAIGLVLVLLAGLVPRNLSAETTVQETAEKILLAAEEETTETTTEATTEITTEETTETTTEATTEEATEATTEATTEEATETTTETTTEEATKTTTETMPETATEETTETEEETTQEVPDTSESEEASYLDFIEVYQSALGTGGTRELTRCEELDEEFGAKVYMVTYGSTWTSTNFYLAAGLSEHAPEDAGLNLSAYDINGEEQKVTMKVSTADKKYRHKLSGTIFGSGANGAKRAIYTLTVGNDEKQQIYKIIVNRELELSSVSCYAEDELTSILTESFSKETRSYQGTVSSEVSKIHIKASQQLNSQFAMAINDETYEAGTVADVALKEEENTIKIRLSQTESYVGEEYNEKTYESVGEYVFTITRALPVNTIFETNPEDAIVCVYDGKGERIYPNEKNDYLFENLLKGETYSYCVTRYNYQAFLGEFVAEPNLKVEVDLDSATYKHTAITNNEWWNYRNNEENNGVTGVSTPENAEEVSEKWAVQIGGDWSNSFTPPLILGGAIYTAAGKYVYKIDKDTGEILTVSEELKGSMVFALNSLTYAEGMVFAQIGNGQIQALNATTLESVWISEPLGGQTLSPITYKNGYIYTGTWNSETSPGMYFCLSVTDEDPNKKDEIKYCTWKYSHKGGFYWAGSYASDEYVVFGSDDGTQEGNYSNNSILYSVTAKDGVLIDKMEGLCGDIRTSVVYHNGYVYVATKGGYLYRVKMNSDGTFGQQVSYKLGGMATASPVVHNNRIYIGVCGQGGQFNADGGHHFAVLNENSSGISLAYTVSIKGYPQAGALLSTAYEKVDYDGDGVADGRVYVYFTYNAFPGGIVGFTDAPGQTSAELETYFEPEGSKQQYCISPLCVDSDGTIYYKNDSCYMMAVESNPAYLNGIEVSASTGGVSWDEEFVKSKANYNVKVPENTTEVTFTLDIPTGRKVTVNGVSCTGIYQLSLGTDGNATADIEVTYENKKKTYQIKVAKLDKNANLADMIISASNNIKDEALGMNPEFLESRFMYTSNVYDGTKKFINIFVKTGNEDAAMEAEAVSGVKKISRANNSAGSEGYTRFSVYFGDNESTAVVNITVTAVDGITKQTYQVTILRTDNYAPNLTEIVGTRVDEDNAYITFYANEAGLYTYKVVDTGTTEPSITESEMNLTLSQGLNRIVLTGLLGKGKDIYIKAVDAYGNVSEEAYKLVLKPYKVFEASIKTIPEDASIQIKDTSGKILTSTSGTWTFIDGNTYYVTVSKEGYETLEEVLVADQAVTEHTYEIQCTYRSNAYLKELYVSSSDKYGAGILKLSLNFDKEWANYAASYEKERSYLNLWLKAEDEKSTVTVYAVSGIKGETVNKDETITAEKNAEDMQNWKIYFGKGATVAKVRIQVKAEDGTVKNYFVTLSIEDNTAPVLIRVSASRIAADKASVVFQTSEQGTYYYEVVDKGAKKPTIAKKNGVDVLAGTVTISLTGLSDGMKKIYIVLVDEAGNESNILEMDIPASQAISSQPLSGKSSGDLAGKTPVLKGAATSKDGNKNGLKKNENGQSNITKTNANKGASQNTTDNENSSSEGNSRFSMKGLDLSDPINQAAMGVAGIGILYLAFWQYSCHWYKKRKKENA